MLLVIITYVAVELFYFHWLSFYKEQKRILMEVLFKYNSFLMGLQGNGLLFETILIKWMNQSNLLLFIYKTLNNQLNFGWHFNK